MALRLDAPMPPLTSATEWLNDGLATETLLGHPVLVYFWSISCHICHENMPRLAAWREHYAGRGLRFIAVHIPRSEEETGVDLVRQGLCDLQISDPCAVDNDLAIADAFQSQFLPSYFLFDADHKLRARTAGNAGLGLLSDALQRLYPVG